MDSLAVARAAVQVMTGQTAESFGIVALKMQQQQDQATVQLLDQLTQSLRASNGGVDILV